MQDLLVRDLKPYETPLTVGEKSTILEMVDLFVQHPGSRFIAVVNDNAKLQGLIRCKRLFQAVFLHHTSSDLMVHQLFTLMTSETSKEIMITHIITVKENDKMNEVIQKMMKNDITSVPVVDDEFRLLGHLTLAQLLKAWLKTRNTS